MGVGEIEEALRVEVLGVCRTYCLQVWNKALNQAGVKASSALRKVENVYFLLAICASSSSDPKVNMVSTKTDGNKDSLAKILPFSNSPLKEVEQAKAVEKEKDITK